MDINLIIKSEARTKILRFFFSSIEKEHHLREISRLTGVKLNSVKRELDNLLNANLIVFRKEFNKKYFKINKEYIGFSELYILFIKSEENIVNIIKFLKNEKIYDDFIYLIITPSFIYNDKSPDRIDILGVMKDSSNKDEVEKKYSSIDTYLNREINSIIFPLNTLKETLKRQDRNIWNILFNKPTFIKGDIYDFLMEQN